MKKSYHSTVVPTTVAKTTRRRSVGGDGAGGVNPRGFVVHSWGDSSVGVTSRRRTAKLACRVTTIIYDFEYDAREHP
jgi:hypothetical protein